MQYDKKNLNYEHFTIEYTERNTFTEFNSNNTELLNVEQTMEKIIALSCIQVGLLKRNNRRINEREVIKIAVIKPEDLENCNEDFSYRCSRIHWKEFVYIA